MKFNSIEEKYALELSISVLKKETPPSAPDGISFEKMFDFCEKHSITVLVYHALKKVPDISIDDALNKKYNESYLKAMGREAKQEFEYRRIAKRFEDNNIDYMPLKGCIMKYLYPLPFLRHMVDMDILIREDDLTKAGNIMLEDGYSGTVEKTLHYHNSFTKKPIFDVELHRSLLADHYIHISKFIDGEVLRFNRGRVDLSDAHNMMTLKGMSQDYIGKF
ncbi:MAG: nucleotidyltransferase family protein, partial [Clostridia bacterium]|nr:nucleotidyltransferase family protein [Clostridia bacterium]